MSKRIWMIAIALCAVFGLSAVLFGASSAGNRW